jgi:hypothetical protein
VIMNAAIVGFLWVIVCWRRYVPRVYIDSDRADVIYINGTLDWYPRKETKREGSAMLEVLSAAADVLLLLLL